MKTKKRIKKKVKIFFVLLVITITASIFLLNKYNDYVYTNSLEYKLLEIGYSLSEIDILHKEFDDEYIDNLLSEEYNENIFIFINEEYYMKSFLEEYISLYEDKDNTYDSKDIVALVNTNAYKEHYTDVQTSNIEDEELILVNKYNKLPSDYITNNMVIISQNYSWGELGTHQANEVVYDAFVMMAEDAKEYGYTLMVNSSYRSYDSQEKIYNDYKDAKGQKYADSIAARAGHSEHQTGYTLDIFSIQSPSLSTFSESDTYQWLRDNSYKYGFIVRYPDDKEYITGYDFESWHYRYVGESIAKYIYQNDITYDEYYAFYIN